MSAWDPLADIPLGRLKTHRCTKADPWDTSKGDLVMHPDAYEVGRQRDGYPGGDLQDYECPHCKHRWTQELPQ